MSNRQFKDIPGSSALSGIVIAQGVSAAISRKVNLTGIIDPGVNDDSGAGYGILSIWCNTVSNKVFICANASVGAAVWKDASGSGGIKETITIANAFSAGNVIRRTSTNYAKSQADSAANAEVFGTIESASGTDFVIVYTGKISLPAHGFTVGAVLFLSAATAGLLTETEPTAIGQVSKPIAIVSDADNLIILNSRGIVQNPTGYGYTTTAISGNVTLTKGTSNTDQQFSGTLGGAYTVNLSRTNAQNGDHFIVALSSIVTTGVNTLTFQENGSGSLKVYSASETLNRLLWFEYTGSAWILLSETKEGTVTSVDASGGVETVSGSAITATGTIRGAHLVNAQTGTTYTYLTGDRGKLVTHTNGSAIAGTLPQATGTFGSGWFMDVQNRGAGTLTITPGTSTIDGAASLALTTGQGVRIFSDGTNYFTQRGGAAATSALAMIVVQDQKASGTNGGTFTNGAWRTRDINTEVVDTGNNCTISANQITLLAGTYRCLIHAGSYNNGSSQARLQNITDSTTLVLGQNARTDAGGAGNGSIAIIDGRFTLSGTKVLEVQHICQTTVATTGFGIPGSFGVNEVYLTATFFKE